MTASYRLTGRIETGDLAELYKASQDSSGDVVVKLFHPKTSDPTYARVLAETSRVLNPRLQNFAQWLENNAGRIPLEG